METILHIVSIQSYEYRSDRIQSDLKESRHSSLWMNQIPEQPEQHSLAVNQSHPSEI
jgi:hypothetical protein